MSSSPFDLLPTEIIQKIFLSCLPENMTILPAENSKKNIVQLVISQVSSRWRSIALDTFQLWDNVMLSNLDTTSLQLVSLWFHRARGFPIALKVQTDLTLFEPRIRDFCRLISLHRFKSVGGNLRNYWFMVQDKIYEESFASLESIYLAFPIVYVEGKPNPTGGDYCRLPSLRYLHLNFRGLDHFPVTRKHGLHMIPWHLLSTLTVHNATNFPVIFEMLYECKALVECRLLKIYGLADIHIGSLEKSTSHLRHFELSSPCPVFHLIKVLSAFNMPNITSIHLTFTSGFNMDRFLLTDWYSKHLDAPFHQVQEVMFSNPNKTFDIRMFLLRMPSLRKLTLHGYVLLDSYTANEISTGRLGRNIDTISLRTCGAVGHLLDMIEKRQENAKSDKIQNLRPFKHVRLAADWGNKFMERAKHLERQYNVRIQMERSIVEGARRK